MSGCVARHGAALGWGCIPAGAPTSASGGAVLPCPMLCQRGAALFTCFHAPPPPPAHPHPPTPPVQYLVFFQHGLLLPTWTLVVLRAFYII